MRHDPSSATLPAQQGFTRATWPRRPSAFQWSDSGQKQRVFEALSSRDAAMYPLMSWLTQPRGEVCP